MLARSTTPRGWSLKVRPMGPHAVRPALGFPVVRQLWELPQIERRGRIDFCADHPATEWAFVILVSP